MRLEKQKWDYILNISKRGSSKVQKLSIKSLISEELITDLRRKLWKFQSSLNSRRKKTDSPAVIQEIKFNSTLNFKIWRVV